MEVKSDPNTYETIHFTDILVSYPGEIRDLTLENGKDTYEETPSCLLVQFANGEVVEFRKARMHWVSITPRTQRRLVKESK